MQSWFNRPLVAAIKYPLVSTVRSLGAALTGRPGSVRRPVIFFIIISSLAGLLAPSFLTVGRSWLSIEASASSMIRLTKHSRQMLSVH